MGMVGHAINCKHFMLVALSNTGNIFLKVLSKMFTDQRVSVLDSKNVLDIQLGIGICHFCFQLVRRKIKENCFECNTQKNISEWY